MSSSLQRFQFSVKINAPVHIAYALWENCENFPEFMFGVQEVRRVAPDRLHWRAEIGGQRAEWDAEIVEEILDSRISWRALSENRAAGTVTFVALGAEEVQVSHEVEMEAAFDDEGKKTVGERIAHDLERFRDFVERSRSPRK